MKDYGKVIKYNGIYGTIKGMDGKDYNLLDKNVVDNNLKTWDYVEFEKETIKTPEVNANIARFVKKIENKMNRKTHSE